MQLFADREQARQVRVSSATHLACQLDASVTQRQASWWVMTSGRRVSTTSGSSLPSSTPRVGTRAHSRLNPSAPLHRPTSRRLPRPALALALRAAARRRVETIQCLQVPVQLGVRGVVPLGCCGEGRLGLLACGGATGRSVELAWRNETGGERRDARMLRRASSVEARLAASRSRSPASSSSSSLTCACHKHAV